MGRNDDTFSAEHRRAMQDAALAGASASEVVAAAAAGELGVPSFKVSETTARNLAREARQEAQRNPQRLAAIAERVLVLTENTLERLEKAPSKPSTADLRRMKQLLPLAEAATHAKNTADRQLREPPSQTGNGTDAPALLASLLEQTANGEEAGEPGPGSELDAQGRYVGARGIRVPPGGLSRF